MGFVKSIQSYPNTENPTFPLPKAFLPFQSNPQPSHLRQLTQNLLPSPIPIRRHTISLILLRLKLPHQLHPSEFILDLALLNSLQLTQKLDNRGAGLVSSAIVFESVIFGAHGDAFDRHQSCGGAGGGDFGEGGEFVVFDLEES